MATEFYPELPKRVHVGHKGRQKLIYAGHAGGEDGRISELVNEDEQDVRLWSRRRTGAARLSPA